MKSKNTAHLIWLRFWPIVLRLGEMDVVDGENMRLCMNVKVTFPWWFPFNWPLIYLQRSAGKKAA